MTFKESPKINFCLKMINFGKHCYLENDALHRQAKYEYVLMDFNGANQKITEKEFNSDLDIILDFRLNKEHILTKIKKANVMLVFSAFVRSGEG